MPCFGREITEGGGEAGERAGESGRDRTTSCSTELPASDAIGGDGRPSQAEVS